MGAGLSRRTFSKTIAAVIPGMISGSAAGFAHDPAGSGPADILSQIRAFRKIDAYGNVMPASNAESQIKFADRLHIERLVISVPVARDMGKSPQEIRQYNDTILQAVKRYPDRLIGQFTVNAADKLTAIDEIKRAIDNGMVGMKIFNQVKINDPVVFPVIEYFAESRMIVHVHGESQLGVGGYRMKYDVRNNPNISVPEDFTDVASRYPGLMFQYAHIGGGSDWEYACKCFANYPNIFVDTGGSNNEEGMIDFAVKTLGEDRVFFGCDSSFYQGVGKVLSSALSGSQKRKIFFDNYNNILKRSGNGIN